MTRDDWERQLDSDPSDTVTRSVYADWLEDHGEPVAAACQRWMVREGKWPTIGTHWHSDAHSWDWWKQWSTFDLPLHCFLQCELFAALEYDGRNSRSRDSCYREYASPREAVAALQVALVALG